MRLSIVSRSKNFVTGANAGRLPPDPEDAELQQGYPAPSFSDTRFDRSFSSGLVGARERAEADVETVPAVDSDNSKGEVHLTVIRNYRYNGPVNTAPFGKSLPELLANCLNENEWWHIWGGNSW